MPQTRLPFERRTRPPSTTVDRRGRSSAPLVKALLALAALAVIATAAVNLRATVETQLADARRAAIAWLEALGIALPDTARIPASPRSAPPAPASASRLQQLHAALVAGDAEHVIAFLAEIPPEELNIPVGGMTALMLASSLGDARVVAGLLGAGADPNARGAAQRTALQYAAEKNRLQVARLLLDAGADINGVDNGSLSPLVMAADRDFTELALLLIERGANVNIQNVDGWTALMDAAEAGNVRVVKALLRAGAHTGARHRDGHTALDFAHRNGHQEIVRLLAERGPSSVRLRTGNAPGSVQDRAPKKGERQ